MQSQSIINENLYYDIVAIGNHAAIVADRINCAHSNKYKVVVLNLITTITEPYSTPIGTQLLSFKVKDKSFDIINKDIVQIQPGHKMVLLQGGDKLVYKFLIYGEVDSEETQNYKHHPLGEALEKQFSRVYSSKFKNQQTIFQTGGNIIFYVPKGSGVFRSNYPFLKVADQTSTIKNTQVFVLMEGTTLYPFCPQGDAFLKEKLKELEVTLIENVTLDRVDYLRRVLYYQREEGKKLQLPFQCIYCYIEDKVPTLLEKAGIDPFDCHRQLLHNKQYDSIYVIGDYLSTTYSFHSLSLQIHHIAYNVAERLAAMEHERKAFLVPYNGHSRFQLPLDNRRTIEVRQSYNQDEFQMEEVGCCWKVFSQWLSGALVRQFYTFANYGPPHFFWPPSLVPSEKWEDEVVMMSEVAEIRKLSQLTIQINKSKQN